MSCTFFTADSLPTEKPKPTPKIEGKISISFFYFILDIMVIENGRHYCYKCKITCIVFLQIFPVISNSLFQQLVGTRHLME